MIMVLWVDVCRQFLQYFILYQQWIVDLKQLDVYAEKKSASNLSIILLKSAFKMPKRGI